MLLFKKFTEEQHGWSGEVTASRCSAPARGMGLGVDHEGLWIMEWILIFIFVANKISGSIFRILPQ